MKIQRTTLVLMLLAILLGGFVYFYEIQWKSQQEEVNKKGQQLFSFKEDDVKMLKITTSSETIILERSPESSNSKWLMKSPDAEPANDATVTYLLDLLEKEGILRTLNISNDELSNFGFKEPRATIDITLNNQKSHKLVLGKLNFDKRSIYARHNFATQEDETIEVVLLSQKFENAINRSLSEWKVKPVEEPETTPSPTPITTPINSTPTIKPIPINPTPKSIITNPTPTPANNE